MQRELIRSVFWTVSLTALFLLFNGSVNRWHDVLIALPFFIVLYFLFFSTGKEVVSSVIKKWIGSAILRMLVFPFLLLVLYFLYMLLNQQNPVQGTLALVPYLVIFPGLLFLVRGYRTQKIDWLDFTAFVIFLLFTTFIKVEPSGNLPFAGKDFGSVYKISLMLIAVYTFGTIRGLNDIGLVPVLNLKFLWTAVWVWFVFYLFVVVVGYSVDFIKYIGHELATNELVAKIGLTLVVTFLNTAIFEELFFRGILQNMLMKRIGQAKSWNIFWLCGLLIAIPLAFLVGYTLKGGCSGFRL